VAVALHAADGHRHVIDQAKAFTVIREGMVEAASYVNAAVVSQGLFGGHNRASGLVPERIDKPLTVGHFQLKFLARAQGSPLQLLHPEFCVDQQEILFVAQWRWKNVSFGKGSLPQKAIPHSTVLP
jgi:hypothetical protein